MSNINFQCYYDENSESYDIPDFEFEQLLEQNRVLREMLEKEQGINQMLNDAIEAQTEHTDKLQAENEKLKAGTLLKFQEVEIEELQEKIAYLETSVQTTANYWESKYENERTERVRLAKYSEIFDDIDGDELTDLLNEHGWEYNDEGELDKKVSETDSEEESETYTDQEEYMISNLGKTFEEAIISDFGDQSEQARKYGFGVFKKSTD
jgi:hypothetical protein